VKKRKLRKQRRRVATWKNLLRGKEGGHRTQKTKEMGKKSERWWAHGPVGRFRNEMTGLIRFTEKYGLKDLPAEPRFFYPAGRVGRTRGRQLGISRKAGQSQGDGRMRSESSIRREIRGIANRVSRRRQREINRKPQRVKLLVGSLHQTGRQKIVGGTL